MSAQDYELELREGQRAILHALYPDDYVKLKQVAKQLGIKFETARQAHQYGKGSSVTINGLIFMGLGVHPTDIKKYIPQVREVVKNNSKTNIIDELIEDARALYGENELIAWLRLLLAKHEVEADLGLRKKSLAKKSKK